MPRKASYAGASDPTDPRQRDPWRRGVPATQYYGHKGLVVNVISGVDLALGTCSGMLVSTGEQRGHPPGRPRLGVEINRNIAAHRAYEH